jgi:[ribosomal protein S18]-alanine N-acetyltransferase
MQARAGDDLDRLMAVMACAFEPTWGEAWTRRQVEDSLVTGNCGYFLIAPDGREAAPGELVAGFILTRLIAGETELLLLAVDPKWRRRGLGGLLLSELERCARAKGAGRLFLEMRRGNPAEALYLRFGFEAVGQRPKYYRTTSGERVDAVTFAKHLEPA